MPGIQDAYNEAIQLASIRLKISDPDIKQGKVEMIKMLSNAGNYQLPWANRGSFAIVYKFHTRDGQFKAIRCFLGSIDPDTQHRYEQMNRFFAAHVPAITAGFQYYDEGINIKMAGQAQVVTRPIIVMDWIEGGRLLDKVDQLCKQQKRAELGRLVEQWVDLISLLMKVGMAHGDLTSENVMIDNGGNLVLVDYDSVYIPEFRGMNCAIIGQEAYQHPQMNDRPFDEHMDDFSAYVIYVALLALYLQPELWEKYNRLPENNLLFTREDFLRPDNSALFAELARIQDADLKKALQALKQACTQPIRGMKLPSLENDAREKEELSRLIEAIDKQTNDALIVQCWTPRLAKYAPAQQYYNQVMAAQQRLQAVRQLQAALKAGNIEEIVRNEAAILYNSKAISSEDLQCFQLAKNFHAACKADDDAAITLAYNAISKSPYQARLLFTPAEKERIQLARQYKAALDRFRLAWYRGKAQEIVAAYDPIFDTYKQLPEDDQEIMTAAKTFLAMYQKVMVALKANNNSGNDKEIFAAYSDDKLGERFTDFTSLEKDRIKLACNRELLRFALRNNMYREVIRRAGEIETQTQERLADEAQRRSVEEAKRRYLKQFHPLKVQASVAGDGQKLTITWTWPADTLIQYAVVAWRNDRWPAHAEEAGVYLSHPIRRQNYELYKGFHLPIGQQRMMYLQVYFALPDSEISTGKTAWIYSDEKEATSRCMIQFP